MATELKGVGNSLGLYNEFSSQNQLTSMKDLSHPHPCRRWGKIGLVMVVFLIALGAGFAVGYFVRAKSVTTETKDLTECPKNSKTNEFHERFLTMIDTKEMEKNLRYFTSRPHVATSKAADDIATFLRNKWKGFGFQVDEPEYEVPISLQQDDKPNTVTIMDNNTRDVEYHITLQLNITAGSSSKEIFKYTPYLAYTPNATVEGELVYVGKGTSHEFDELVKRNITVKGRIVIMCTIFGSILNAERYGAIGVIIYPDPSIYARQGQTPNDTYPNSGWLPSDAVQRISEISHLGDPYTPILPATRGMYRLPESKIKLPRIPAQTISYHDARYIMRRMGGMKVPDYMTGKLDTDYRFGPLLSKNNRTSIVRLQVNNQIYKKKVHNVIATIPGVVEPDRIVIIGNHRDSWTFGSSDPSSGTTTLTEISRILAALHKQGWRPRRTIKLCSWGGEEMGLLGSNEWVEENEALIRERVVTYLNTDVAVGGNFVIFAQTSTILHELILKHTKKVKDPQDNTRTIYDNMLARMATSKDYPGEPRLNSFNYLSDNMPFCLYSGVSTADFSYFFGYKDKRPVLYPVYHSQYDTFEWIKKVADPKFLHFKAMTQLLGSMLMDTADSAILPFSVQRFGRSVQNAYKRLVNDFNFTFHNSHIILNETKIAVNEFVNLTIDFNSKKQKLTCREDVLVLRKFNDQMANLEKVFVSPYVQSEWRPQRKLVFREIFYSVLDVLNQYARTNKTEERDEKVYFELSLVLHAIKSANSLLLPIIRGNDKLL